MKKLYVAQIFGLLLCASFPFVEGMFVWHVTGVDHPYVHSIPMSLYKLIVDQVIISGMDTLFVVFMIGIACAVVLYIYAINSSHGNICNLFSGILPVFCCIAYAVMAFSAGNHTMFFNSSSGRRMVSIAMNPLAYIELALLTAVFVIGIVNIYKQQKATEEGVEL